MVAGSELAAVYGQTRWGTLGEMPADVREYFVRTVTDVADFFNVRPGDIAAILRAEQNNAGWTLEEPGVSSAGARGVAQVVARTWNGWSNPHKDEHTRSLAEIERYGGIGFDWAARDEWRAWKEGRLPLEALEDTNADPSLFENGVAAIARHLVHWGLTRDAFERDPDAAARRLADAIAVYNSGKVLSVSRDFTQSTSNHKTVGEYVAQALVTSAAWDAEVAASGLLGGNTETLKRVQPEMPTSGRFAVTPLDPMPRVVKPFGARVNYQVGGKHTGIDVAGPDNAPLYAVADGTITYVGPLFCDRPRACRGPYAVVLDLGNNLYAIYSHNSAALVKAGDQVKAGQVIARQGNEGYSSSSHLHFEVHAGCPWSGDWSAPFACGEFVDPMLLMPAGGDPP